ncbi:MAG: hypothetical protein MUF34_19790 [Polyangiaceae bacterium]|nr:hypothetical protein [Polyangiaceae bacterium]
MTLFAAGCVQPLPLPPSGDDDDNNTGGWGGWGGSGGSGGGSGGWAGWGGSSGDAGAGGSGGAPPPTRSTLAADVVLDILRGDLATIPRDEQPNTRYVSLHSFYNDRRFSNLEIGAAASAVSKLVNHLSPRAAQVRRPELVFADDSLPIAVRLNLAEHDVDANDWALLEGASEVPGRDHSPCAVPLLTVEQFLGIGSADAHYQAVAEQFVSVYSNIGLRRALEAKGLLAPGQLVFDPLSKPQFIANGFTNVSNVTFVDVATALGVDLAANLASGNRNVVQRACTLNSGLSANARCSERHATPDAPGPGLWWTMDFLSENSTASDAFAFPIGPSNGGLVPPVGAEASFALEGGEALWSWPNGLLGFTSFNGNLNLVSSAPILSPLASPPEQTFLASAACFSCHANAVIPLTDQLLPRALETNGEYSAAELGFILQHVPQQAQLDALFDLDSQAYRSALRDAYYTIGADGDLPDGIYALGSQYLFDMSLDQVLATLAISRDEFIDLLNRGNFVDFGAVLLDQGSVSRENFTLFTHQLYQALDQPQEGLLSECVVRQLDGDLETPPTND